jgi:hypothetical protein
VAFADGQIVGIPRKSPSTANTGNQHILAVEQALAGAGSTGTNMVMELVQKKGIEGATVGHTKPAVTNSTSAQTALAGDEKRVVAVFYNSGPATVYLRADDGSNTAATTNDLPLESGMVFTDQWTTLTWYVIGASATAGDHDLRVMQVLLQESDTAQTI